MVSTPRFIVIVFALYAIGVVHRREFSALWADPVAWIKNCLDIELSTYKEFVSILHHIISTHTPVPAHRWEAFSLMSDKGFEMAAGPVFIMTILLLGFF